MSVFESLLNHTATGERRRRTTDGQGGFVIDYVPLDSEEVRIRPASSRERELAMREEREVSHVMYARASADIERGDRWTVDGLVVEVMAIREPSKAGEHYEIDCLEYQVEETEEGS